MAGIVFPTWDQLGIPELIPEYIRKLNNPNKIKFLLDYLIFKNSCFKITIKYCCGVCSHYFTGKKITDDYPECHACGSKFIRAQYHLSYMNSGGSGPFFLQHEIPAPPPLQEGNIGNIQGIFNFHVANPIIQQHNIEVEENAPDGVNIQNQPVIAMQGQPMQIVEADMAEDMPEDAGDDNAPKKYKDSDRLGFLCKIMTEFYRARFKDMVIPASDIFTIKWVGTGFAAEFLGGEQVICNSPETTIGKAALLVPAIWDLDYDLALKRKSTVNSYTHDYTPILATLFNLQINF